MRLMVDVLDTPPPPQQLPEPLDTPQAPHADSIIQFDTSGRPVNVPAGVTVTPLQADETPIGLGGAFATREWRYRIEWRDLPVVYGGAREKGVVIYARAEETVRPGEWGAWGHAREMVIAPNPLPPPTPAPLPAEYPTWASLPDAAGLSLASVEWQPTGAWGYRVYEATEAALRAACGQPGPVLTEGYSRRIEALFRLYANPANHAALRATYRKLGDQAISPPLQPNEKMRFEALLPRGSRLIHCFIVVGVSENNVVSDWPAAELRTGRRGFMAYAIPRPLQPAQPELHGTATPGGLPQITVSVAGARPVASICLYRTQKPILARNVATMQQIGAATPDVAEWQQRLATDPAAWQKAEFTDAGATPGWQWVQYRAVAQFAHDLDIAGMAVDSSASPAFQLLYPPPGPPVLDIAEITNRRSATQAVLRIETDGPRDGTAVGDHMLAWVVRQGTGPLVRGSAPLSGLQHFASLDAMIAGTQAAGYVGTELYLRLARTGGAALSLTVDMVDPLSRSTHRVVELPAYVADVKPVISSFNVVRHNTLTDRAVWIGMVCNAPASLKPAHDWTLSLRYRPATGLLQTWTTRSIAVSAMPVVKTLAEVPTPAAFKGAWLATRVGKARQFVMWIRSTTALTVAVALTNSTGQSASQQATSL
jgi:hypothetical protein